MTFQKTQRHFTKYFTKHDEISQNIVFWKKRQYFGKQQRCVKNDISENTT